MQKIRVFRRRLAGALSFLGEIEHEGHHERFKSVAGIFTQKVCSTRGQYFAVGRYGKSSICCP